MPHTPLSRSTAPRRLRCAGGFTIVELMIVLLVIGVLTALAYPSFMDSIRKGRRSEAFAAISAVQQAQEGWRSRHADYATNSQLTLARPDDGLGLLATTPNGYYTLELSTESKTGYTITATGAKSQAADGNCVRLLVEVVSGNVTPKGAPSSGSFDTDNANKCWPQ